MGIKTGLELDKLKSENRKASSLLLEWLTIIIGRHVFIFNSYGSLLRLTLVNYAANRRVRLSSQVTQGEWEAPACGNIRTNKGTFGSVPISIDKSIFHFSLQ